jgi:exodeoxyribonuclease V alpha subunit
MNDESEFSALDWQFGDFLERLAGGSAPEVQLAARYASHARAEGHICVPLDQIPATGNKATLRKNLRASKVVGAPGEFTPLILDDRDRLYLRRYWEYEQQLAAAILQRAKSGTSARTKKKETDLQKVAAGKAVGSNFTVITGGPGTGKTQTVMEILKLFLAQPDGDKLQIKLAAPTGKAAARLTEAVREVREDFKATTIHRLLGYLPGSPYFRHDANYRLSADVVIVDEASMVDLALMAKLVAAVPNEARLILLGDRDQLASVEAGNVLADICAAAEAAAPDEPLHGAVVALQKNYRFAESGGIYRVSNAINAGEAEAALAILRENDKGEVQWQTPPAAPNLAGALHHHVVASYRAALAAGDPRETLEQFQQFRILCAVRQGPFGVENLNTIAEEILAEAGLLRPRRGLYPGQPLIITQNDYNLALFNGDSGVILPDPEAGGELRAFFLTAENRVRRFLPARLPAHENAFAMTVHKSQGSEFAKVLLILPEKDSPILTRELLYTGLTRAREGVELWATEPALRAAIGRRVSRTSGLREALAGRPSKSRQSGSNR